MQRKVGGKPERYKQVPVNVNPSIATTADATSSHPAINSKGGIQPYLRVKLITRAYQIERIDLSWMADP